MVSRASRHVLHVLRDRYILFVCRGSEVSAVSDNIKARGWTETMNIRHHYRESHKISECQAPLGRGCTNVMMFAEGDEIAMLRYGSLRARDAAGRSLSATLQRLRHASSDLGNEKETCSND